MSLIASMFGLAMARAFSAPVGEHRIDVAGIGGEPEDFGADRRELLDRDVGQRVLERRKLTAAEPVNDFGFGLVGQRCIDPDEVVRLGHAPAKPSRCLGRGSGSVFALRIFCAIVSASSVSAM